MDAGEVDAAGADAAEKDSDRPTLQLDNCNASFPKALSGLEVPCHLPEELKEQLQTCHFEAHVCRAAHCWAQAHGSYSLLSMEMVLQSFAGEVLGVALQPPQCVLGALCMDSTNDEAEKLGAKLLPLLSRAEAVGLLSRRGPGGHTPIHIAAASG